MLTECYKIKKEETCVINNENYIYKDDNEVSITMINKIIINVAFRICINAI